MNAKDIGHGIYRPIPRVICDVPLSTTFPDGTTDFPVRARDDLDPCDPPFEFSDGRISWCGYQTREQRDEARHQRALKLEQELTAAAQARAAAIREEEQAREIRRIAAVRERVQLCLRHRAISTSEAWGFVGPVSRDENQAAHGNVGYTETCRCGATRARLVNQHHEEVGEWSAPE